MTAGLTPDVLNYAWRDYGARVGVVAPDGGAGAAGLRRHGGAELGGLPAVSADRRGGVRLGWEWMAHGQNNSSLFTGMPEEVERPILEEVLDTIAAHTGKRCRGWLGPALTETGNTLDLLAELGSNMSRTGATMSCPTPCAPGAAVRSSPCPTPWRLAISPAFLQHGGSGEAFHQMIVDQFDVLYQEGETLPRVMSIAVHPFLIGPPLPGQAPRAGSGPHQGPRQGLDRHRGEILDWWRGAQAG